MRKYLGKNKDNIMVFGVAAIILFLVYCGFLNHSFTSDHMDFRLTRIDPDYILYTRPAINPWGHIKTMSWMYYFIEWIQFFFFKAGVTKDSNQFVLQIVLILLLAYAVTLLFNLYKNFFEDKKKRVVLLLLIMLGYISPFFCELFVYVAWEKILGVIAAIWGVMLFTKKKYVGSFFCITLAVTTYEVYYVLFLIYASTWIYLSCKGNVSKQLWLAFAKMYTVMIGPPLICVGIFFIGKRLGINIYSGKSIPLDDSILDRIIWMKKMFVSMTVTQMGLLPRYFLLCCFVVCGILIAVLYYKKKIMNLVFAIIHVIAMSLYPVSIFLIATNESTFGRIVWPVFASLSGLMMLILYHTSFNKKLLTRGLTVALALYICIVSFSTSSTITNVYKSNALDEQIVRQVAAQIELYEYETGISVQKIAAGANPNSQNSYPQVGFLGMDYSNLDAGYYNFTHKALKDNWSNDELFIYLTARPYSVVNMDEEVWNSHFAGKGWETFVPQEQLYFEGDTLYWCIY